MSSLYSSQAGDLPSKSNEHYVVPIPGSKNKERIIENLDSANVELTDEEFTALEEALNGLKVYGHRGLGGF